MKKGNETISVVLSKAQIRELLFAVDQHRFLKSPDLKQAQTNLRRMLRETKASNDPQPLNQQKETA